MDDDSGVGSFQIREGTLKLLKEEVRRRQHPNEKSEVIHGSSFSQADKSPGLELSVGLNCSGHCCHIPAFQFPLAEVSLASKVPMALLVLSQVLKCHGFSAW